MSTSTTTLPTFIVASLMLTTAATGAIAGNIDHEGTKAPLDEGWQGEPTNLGGTDRYDDGEWIYQDFVYDDYGADTGGGSQPISLAHTAGDFRYPDDPAYAQNAADILEIRVRPSGDDLDVRVELNSLVEQGTTVIGLGIDEGAGQARAWPMDAGVESVWDRFVTVADGDVWINRAQGPSVHVGSADVDLEANTISFRVPNVGDQAAVDLTAGAGLWDPGKEAWMAGSPAPEATGGFDSGNVPTNVRVFDLGFNAREIEPRDGSWQDDAQAEALLSTDVSEFTQRVDLDRVRSGATDERILDPGFYNRIFESIQDLGEGKQAGAAGDEEPFPQYLGEHQPYALWIPEGYDHSTQTPVVLNLHSLEVNHNQYSGGESYPAFYEQVGDGLDAIVATPLARGPDGWYENEALVDTLEVLEDVREHYNVDEDRTFVTGYSMGGFGTYRLSTLFADRFAAGASWSGVPASQHLLGNVHDVPIHIVHGTNDELVPITDVRAQADRLAELGNEYRFHEHPGIDHFALAFLDEWSRTVQWFDGRKVETQSPGVVSLTVQPSTQIAERTDRRSAQQETVIRDNVESLGYDLSSSFWVEDVDVRGDESTTAHVNATSLAVADREPAVTPYSSTQLGPPTPYVEEGNLRTLEEAPTTNALEVSLQAVGAVTLDVEQARIDTGSTIFVPVETDGPSTLTLQGEFPDGVSVTDADTGDPLDFTRVEEGIRVEVDAPGITLKIEP